jgi:hypothetical protein
MASWDYSIALEVHGTELDALQKRMSTRRIPAIIQLFNEVFGKVAAEMIAEGQSDAAVLREFRERYMLKRRAISVKMFKEASKSGEFKCSVDPELLSDLIFGPIYYRLLVKHQPLSQEFGTALVEHVLGCIK